MKKILIIITLFIFLLPISVNAQRGCCSWHGGVVGCSPDGRQVCSDGTLSPSCTCTPDVIRGCTDKGAKNYDSNANSDDGSCEYKNNEVVINSTEESAKEEVVEEESDDDSDFATGLAFVACGGIVIAFYKGKKNKKELQGK